jgi:Fic family protein
MRELAKANRFLAELKGRAATIPNPNILIDTLSLQEAKSSSEIENIVTTQDELFQGNLFPDGPMSADAKEVILYRDALKKGYDRPLMSNGLITSNTLIEIYCILKQTVGGFRNLQGTALKNEKAGQIIYVPPQNVNDIIKHMTELESYINLDQLCDLDPLIKMAIIHHQFESIHPFPDGNGRIGRILNILYLVKSDLIATPIIYLSRYIAQYKSDYYRLLQHTRDTGQWEPWIIYMLRAVAETSQQALVLIEHIRQIMASYKSKLRENHRRVYSQDLLNNLDTPNN